MMIWLAIGFALTWLVFLGFGFVMYKLMLHSGRLLLRVEQLESRLGELASPDRRPDAPQLRSSPGLAAIARESRIARGGLSVGTAAPGFRLPRVGGGELSLEEYRGQPVLLVFSDPGCGPCNELAPKLERLHRQSLDLEVLMVSRGSPADNVAKIAEHGLTFPVVLQRHWEISRLYAMFATPIGYLLDEQLTVVAEVAAGADAILRLATGRLTPSHPA